MWGPNKENAGCYDYPDCSEEPCQHGGTCTEGPDGCEELNDQELVMVDCYTCTCVCGWTGFDCSTATAAWVMVSGQLVPASAWWCR